MSLAELEKKIVYSTERFAQAGNVQVVARLEVSGSVQVAVQSFGVGGNEVTRMAQAQAREELLRQLYEQPGKEIYDAVRVLMIEAHPAAFGSGFMAAKERLFKAVARRPPADCELFGFAQIEGLQVLEQENKQLKKLLERFVKWSEEKHFVPGKLNALVAATRKVLHA